MNPDRTPKTTSVRPSYGSKSPAKNVDVNKRVEANWASQYMGCLFKKRHNQQRQVCIVDNVTYAMRSLQPTYINFTYALHIYH